MLPQRRIVTLVAIASLIFSDMAVLWHSAQHIHENATVTSACSTTHDTCCHHGRDSEQLPSTDKDSSPENLPVHDSDHCALCRALLSASITSLTQDGHDWAHSILSDLEISLYAAPTVETVFLGATPHRGPPA